MFLVPQFGLLQATGDELLKKILLFGSLVLTISSFSHVSGVHIRMYRRSKGEFVVNRGVATFMGWLFVDIILAVAQNELIGRTVFALGVVLDVVFATMIAERFRSLSPSSGLVVFVSPFPNEEFVSSLKKEGFEILECDPKIQIWNEIEQGFQTPTAVIVEKGHLTESDSTLARAGLGKLVMSTNLFYRKILQRVSVADLAGGRWWTVHSSVSVDEFSLVKRIFDVVVGLVGCFASVPVIIAIWLIYKATDGGPVIYSQVRQGQYGNPFRIYKIRSMRVDSEVGGVRWAARNDDRTTNVGRILRRTRLDEVPQFWNVLKGEMSFIGPRPERPELAERICKSVPEFSIRLAAKPGITGWAQVNYPYGASVEDAVKKLEYDVFYIQNATLLFEARIILRTILAMVKGAR
jgi:lipopolysaccharide/colanic/teichoic acid biosynthesis glycosyltransferase